MTDEDLSVAAWREFCLEAERIDLAHGRDERGRGPSGP